MVPIFAWFLFSASMGAPSAAAIDSAQRVYEEAREAPTFYSQQNELERALASLLVLRTNQMSFQQGARIESAIGAIYEARGQLPEASLHYRRALALLPNDLEVQEKLHSLLDRLRLPLDYSVPWISPATLRLGLLGSGLFLFFLLSFAIWTQIPLGGRKLVLFFLPLGSFFLLFCYRHYLTPVEGVVLHDGFFSTENIRPGQKVSIVSIDNQRKSFLIVTEGNKGIEIDQTAIGLIG